MRSLPVRRNVGSTTPFDGPNSVVVDQAENRLRAALLLELIRPRVLTDDSRRPRIPP
jgi:hypothetical protein